MDRLSSKEASERPGQSFHGWAPNRKNAACKTVCHLLLGFPFYSGGRLRAHNCNLNGNASPFEAVRRYASPFLAVSEEKRSSSCKVRKRKEEYFSADVQSAKRLILQITFQGRATPVTGGDELPVLIGLKTK